MASHIYPTRGFSLLQELGSNEIIKKSRVYQVNPEGRKQELVLESSFNLKPEHLQPWKRFCALSKSNHFVELDSTMMKPRLMDVDGQEAGPEPLRLSLGITEQYAREEKVVEFFFPRSEEHEEREFDMSMLSELKGLQALRSNSQLPYASSSVFYLNKEHPKSLLDLIVDGNNLFSSSRKLNDIVSIAAEFHMLRNPRRWRKLSRLVPQFQRFDSEVLIETLQLPAVKPDEVTLAPLKRLEKTRLEPSTKKHNPKIDREKDLYKRNHLHACERLISLMIGSEQHRKTTMLSIKKSCGDLSELLTQFSIGIAGTGGAVFFSVVCNVASGRVPFCANKVFDTALGFSLILLSWAVSRLREAIVDVNRKAINYEEMTNRIETRIKDVYLRAATVIVMVALRFG